MNNRITASPEFEQKCNKIIATGLPYTVVAVVTTRDGQQVEVCFDSLKGGIDSEALQKGTVFSLETVATMTNSMPVNMNLVDCRLMASA